MNIDVINLILHAIYYMISLQDHQSLNFAFKAFWMVLSAAKENIRVMRNLQTT